MGGITLRELDAKQITETVAQMCKEAAYYLPKDVYEGLKKGRETEKSPVGRPCSTRSSRTQKSHAMKIARTARIPA